MELTAQELFDYINDECIDHETGQYKYSILGVTHQSLAKNSAIGLADDNGDILINIVGIAIPLNEGVIIRECFAFNREITLIPLHIQKGKYEVILEKDNLFIGGSYTIEYQPPNHTEN